MNYGIALGHAVEGTRHKGIVIRRIAENDQLRTAERAVFRGSSRRFLDHLSHAAHGVHIETGAGGTHIYRAAYPLRPRERLGDGVDQQRLRLCHAFCDQRGVSADKVDADFLGRAVQSLRDFRKVFFAPASRAAD